ncbi:unnamed protein product [Symbiodinium natans]|uniref:Ion transport domain-containing protein n=1 Tax=Symbiodinium natans TaxID=878477 RepID=A0A812HVK0_9DINO|nr:unnamed protein product [Symbiodinium natans]
MSSHDSSADSASSREGETDFVVEEVEVHIEDSQDGSPAAVEEEESFDECLEKYQTVQEHLLEDIRIQEDVAECVKEVWNRFISSQSSRDAAGEAIYSAVFDAAPSLQGLFKTPRSVMAMRFMNGLTSIVNICHNPSALRTQVEALGFQHLDLEVTAPRVAIFREAIVDLLEMELPNGLPSKARVGLQALLNYSGGAYIYIRREYSARVKIIQRSWRVANNKDTEEEGEQVDEAAAATVTPDNESDLLQKSVEKTQRAASKESKDSEGAPVRRDSKTEANTIKTTATELKVPTTFNEMFLFNAAVMGFGQSTWMHLVLDQFDDIVSNVANSYRLQEECDVLSLVLAQHPGSIRLSEFKAVMLASLRSLVPKEWDSNHEVAWNWLWENVERMLRSHIGKPQAHEEALGRFILSLSESSILFLRQELYRRFFAVAPAGQDHFKQSTTRLYFIADKIIEMTIEIFRSPRQMVVDISALGLRHVGYEVPTELFAPFVSAAVDVVRGMTTDEVAEAAFRWSLTLVSKILVRTVLEGSTIVMRAINTNQEKALRKAIAVAPRGRRATELLEIRVGTQSISPLMWAIESGSLNCAKAMIQDLLTIRADRDNYYYGCDDLFSRHPNIIQKLCAEAPTLLKPLLDGLVWRSRITFQGKRRVNYYLKHLVQTEEGRFNQALEWLADFKDPQIISHSVVALFADIVWNRLAMYYFLLTRLYFLLTLCVFATSQAILGSSDARTHSEEENIAIFVCRAFIYVGSMLHMFIREIRLFVHDWRHGAMERLFNKVPIPEFLCSGQELGNLLLLFMLIFMCAQEPIWWCIPDMYGDFPGAGLFTTSCDAGEQHKEAYAAFSCAAMLLYCLLILDLSIVSMRISAFVLVCGRVVAEVGLFLMAAVFLIVSFSLGISALDRQSPSFEGIGNAAFSLFAMTLGLYPTDNLGELKDSVGVLITVSVFTILVAIFLLNLLVAQLNQAYQIIFPDMQGYARLNRASVIVATVDQVSQKRWSKFLQSLNLDERLEFNEGDVGLAGGIQVMEPSWANPTTVDSIRRFGGSTSPSMPWPEDEKHYSDEDRFERLEKLMIRATKGAKKKGSRLSAMTSGTTSNSSGTGHSSSSSEHTSDHVL